MRAYGVRGPQKCTSSGNGSRIVMNIASVVLPLFRKDDEVCLDLVDAEESFKTTYHTAQVFLMPKIGLKFGYVTG